MVQLLLALLPPDMAHRRLRLSPAKKKEHNRHAKKQSTENKPNQTDQLLGLHTSVLLGIKAVCDFSTSENLKDETVGIKVEDFNHALTEGTANNPK